MNAIPLTIRKQLSSFFDGTASVEYTIEGDMVDIRLRWHDKLLPPIKRHIEVLRRYDESSMDMEFLISDLHKTLEDERESNRVRHINSGTAEAERRWREKFTFAERQEIDTALRNMNRRNNPNLHAKSDDPLSNPAYDMGSLTRLIDSLIREIRQRPNVHQNELFG